MNILAFIKKHTEIIFISAFFLILLLIGLGIYRDYGLHWDSRYQVELGELNYRYIFLKDQALLQYRYRYYGPLFEIFLYIVTRGIPIREMYFTQHLLTFLFFYGGVICFYFLVKLVFKDWRLGLVGCLFLVLSPRIFADSFYNTKDIPFMAAFILATYTLLRLNEKMNWTRILIHGLTSAILIALRLQGVLVLAMTMVFIEIDFINQHAGKPRRKIIAMGLLYILLTAGLVILFFPTLWKNPMGEFIHGLEQLSRFPWTGGAVLYRGRMVDASNLPWHYVPVWVVITTPLIISALFVIGFGWQGLWLLKKPQELLDYHRGFLLAMMWLVIPVAVVILLRSVLYDGWRHMYFIYPAYLLIALYGLQNLLTIKSKRISRDSFQLVILLLVVIELAFPLGFMLHNHPYEHVFFNRLAGSDYSEIKKKFEMDYWGLSYRQTLEYLLLHDNRPLIKLKADNSPGELNALLLPTEDRQRLSFVKSIDETDYFITNFRWHPEDYHYDKYHEIMVEDVSINAIYILKR